MKYFVSLAFFLSLFFFTTQTYALTIDTIGSSATTTGNPGSDWYYTATNPTFSGTSNANDTVTFAINGTNYTTTADASGNWTYTPTALVNGDHTLGVSDTTASFNFTMHIGQSAPGSGSVATGSGQTLPVSGSLTNTLALLGAGAIFMAVGFRMQFAKQKA